MQKVSPLIAAPVNDHLVGANSLRSDTVKILSEDFHSVFYLIRNKLIICSWRWDKH